VSENRAWDIVEEALRVGASGYVVKSSAANELLAAIWAVLAGKQFLSAGLADHGLTDPETKHCQHFLAKPDHRSAKQEGAIARHHEVGFYSDDRGLLDASRSSSELRSRSGMPLSLAQLSHTGIVSL
jgi:DNA-binding response OmpR family regulator